MTLNEKLNGLNARIEYLGGLSALAPYIPYPIDLIKEMLKANQSAVDADKSDVWCKAAGYTYDEKLKSYVATYAKDTIWTLFNSKGITEVSCSEGVAILKGAAEQIAALSREEINKLYPTQMRRYYVNMLVGSIVTVSVEAINAKQALAHAVINFKSACCGDMECTCKAVDFRVGTTVFNSTLRRFAIDLPLGREPDVEVDKVRRYYVNLLCELTLSVPVLVDDPAKAVNTAIDIFEKYYATEMSYESQKVVNITDFDGKIVDVEVDEVVE